MKLSDVEVGKVYLAKVSGNTVRVRVIGTRADGFSGRMKCVCEREDNGKRLDKLRSASALTPVRES